MSTFDDQTPEISYPTQWSYRIVGTCADTIRTLALEIVGDLEHTFEASRASSSGKYVSYRLALVVEDETHRLSVYERLGADDTIRYVL